MKARSILSRVLIGALALLGAHTAVHAADPNDAFVIGGWDTVRGGALSIESGSLFEEARASLALNYPNASFASITELSATSLAGVDMLILTSGAENDLPITPLTAAEQSALVAFVQGGGGALLLADNDSFGGPPNNPNPPPDASTIVSNDSLVSPFGLSVTDTFVGFPVAVVTDATSPVANGPFGTVSVIATVYPGTLDNLGPNAFSLAEVSGYGDLLAEIPQGDLGTDSGAVVIASDFSMFVDGSDLGDDGKFTDTTGVTDGNETLFLNIISAICRVPGTGGPPPDDEPIEVEIDIKPGNTTNPVNPFVLGLIPVAILGSDTFDVADVVVATLAFGPNGAAPAHAQGGHIQDVNEDGFMDLLSHYWTQETGIASGDTEACVTGETLDASAFEGCDDINTQTSCGGGYAAALVVPPVLWVSGWRRRRKS